MALAWPVGPSVPDPWASPSTDNAIRLPMRLCQEVRLSYSGYRSSISLQLENIFLFLLKGPGTGGEV